MLEISIKLEKLIKDGLNYFTRSSELELSKKESINKWSKKEILGHLIDSGINNLQRFTEIQFKSKPYLIIKYNQDELVKANDYQKSELTNLIELWKVINIQIIYLIKKQTEQTLNYKIELEKDNFSNLQFLIIDYVYHLEHHLKQIKE